MHMGPVQQYMIRYDISSELIVTIVVQFGSRMAIQPSSCETIVGMYNIYLNNEKVQTKMVPSVQYEYRCIQCSVWAQMIMCECLDYYVLYLE